MDSMWQWVVLCKTCVNVLHVALHFTKQLVPAILINCMCHKRCQSLVMVTWTPWWSNRWPTVQVQHTGSVQQR